jgi:trans-2,3-dihydro-3-hydroxyanthranilate isomerase
MGDHSFITVDVFTDRPLTGNPLAVFPDAEGLDGRTMQAIAREFGHSETTFVLRPRQAKALWRLRCFSPTAEVFGAGHNALGAWWVLVATGRVALDTGAAQTLVHQELGDGVLPVELQHPSGKLERVRMTQAPPTFTQAFRDITGLAGALGIAADQLEPPPLRPQAVSTGAKHLLVPVRGLSVLEKLVLDAERLLTLVRPIGCQGAYVFTRETNAATSSAHARAFFPGIGIFEDPATGSAAGPLGAYLAAHGLIRPSVPIVVEQGDEMGRPSRIEVCVDGDLVQVGGQCALVIEGTLHA